MPLTAICCDLCLCRHYVMGDHKSVLADQLASCQEQVRTLQSELAIYQQLLEEVRTSSASTTVAGAQASPSGEGARRKGGVADERVLRLLREVGGLREQLDTCIRNNNTMAEELKGRLDHTSGGGASKQRSTYTSMRSSTLTKGGGKGVWL